MNTLSFTAARSLTIWLMAGILLLASGVVSADVAYSSWPLPGEDLLSARVLIKLLAVSSLVWVGFYYGYQFFQLGNHMLGWEWFFLATSGFCHLLLKAGLSASAGTVMHFLDVFSRLVGVTIIGAIGLMKVTHHFQLSTRNEILVFAVGLIASYVFMAWDIFAPIRPVTYLLVGAFFIGLLIYIAYQMFRFGIALHGWAMVGAIAATLFVSLTEDYIRFPHNDTALLLNDVVIAHVAWSFSFAEIYYAYRALARVKGFPETPLRATVTKPLGATR